MSHGRFRVGIDVGGTFTDLVLWDGATGVLSLHKVPTTPADIASGLSEALRKGGVPAPDIAEIAHGTTVATNALLERKGARTGLLTTAGFRDVLELRDGSRRGLLDRQAAVDPLVPRPWRREVGERLDASGAVIERLHEDEVKTAGAALRQEGVEALALAFLHADRNDAHERRARDILNRLWPAGHVILGSESCPLPDERLRTATAVLAAYLTPLMAGYVNSLQRVLGEAGIPARFRFIESAGGTCAPDEIRHHPLRTMLSGPAGGAKAAGLLAELLGLPAAVTADMGGTSFDVAVIHEGQPDLTGTRSVEFGLTVAVPSVAIHSAAIGGGSLVWMDESLPGGVHVGPESAGAYPGPACFGRGGRKPTVTDASLLLGRLVGDRIDLGLPPLDAGPARQAMLAEVCPGLGLDPANAARVVLDVTEARMVGFVRAELAARGVPPNDASLIAFGGAGPVHAASIARKLDLKRVVIPYLAAGFSALGCLLCPPAHVGMVPVDATLRDLTPERLRALITGALSGRDGGRLRVALILRRGEKVREEMLPVWDSGEPVDRRILRYHAFTRQAYGICPLPEAVRVVSLLAVSEEAGSPIALDASLRATFAQARERYPGAAVPARAAGQGAVPASPMESLPVGCPGRGPALVVLPGASAFVPDGVSYRVDEFGDLILETDQNPKAAIRKDSSGGAR